MQALYKSWLLFAAVAIGISHQGCVKDKCKTTVTLTMYTPVLKATADVRAEYQIQAPAEIAAPGKIYMKGNYIFLNELNKGIHVIDNSNPSKPRNISFINIPGNVDLAITGNTLYADSYMDLLVFDISNPAAPQLKNRSDFAFTTAYQYRFTDSRDTLITGYAPRDTTYEQECSGPLVYVCYDGFYYSSASGGQALNSASSNSGGGGITKGGSMARFTVMNQTLYTIDQHTIHAFDIAQPQNPVLSTSTPMPFGIETLFPYKQYLFVGASTGMYIMDAASPKAPVLKGRFEHMRACDPVVVENDVAYVTLRNGNTCTGTANQLDVLDVKNITQPKRIKTYEMKNPWGLGIDNGRLFICEGKSGLKFLDASNTLDIKTVKWLEGLETYDVIPHDNLLLVSALDGLYQYDYKNLNNPVLLSKIAITSKH